VAVVLGWVGVATALYAAPFTPTHDAEVVQTLSTRWSPGARQQYAQWARQPQQLPLALATARQAIERSRLTGDPRELGLAQAALALWWTLPQPPATVRLLRATLAQSQHDFTAALLDLNVLAVNNTSPPIPLELQAQARLTQAAVLQATGALAQAMQACMALRSEQFAPLGQAVSVPARACMAELDSLQGQTQRAAAALAALATQAPHNPWLALVRAELAQRMNDPAAAKARFHEALQPTEAGGSTDIYTRAAYADWLLEQGQAKGVLALVPASDNTTPDALLLRRAIALHQLGHAEAAAAAAQLQARFTAARQRGVNLHAREEARLALEVLGQPEQALALARHNWAQQKEPADAVLLWRAATAARQPQVAQTLIGCLPHPAQVDHRLSGLCPATRR
jgi:hypothetical protein